MSLKDLHEKRLAAAAKVKELAERQASWTAEDEGNWTKVNSDYDAAAAAVKSEEERLAKDESVQLRLKEIEQQMRSASGDRRIGVDAEQRRQAAPEFVAETENRDAVLALQAWSMVANRHVIHRELSSEHRAACERFGINPMSDSIDVRLGKQGISAPPIWSSLNGCGVTREMREQRTDAPMYIAGSNVGSQFIPQGFADAFEKKLIAYDGPRQVARIWQTPSGNTIPWPTVDDTGNSGAQLAENTTMADALAATTGAISFTAYKFESKPIQVSQELMEDSAFDLASLAGELLGDRIGRAEATAHTTGSGSSACKGIVTCATAGVTAASATAIAPDEVLGLIHSLDPAYRRANPNVGFMMHDSILLYLRKLKDADGQYLWQPGLQMGVPDRLLGYPVVINQAMQSSVATATVTMLFADFSKFIIRDSGTVRLYRLDELYRAKDLTGFCAFHRTDSNTIATTAIRKLTQA